MGRGWARPGIAAAAGCRNRRSAMRCARPGRAAAMLLRRPGRRGRRRAPRAGRRRCCRCCPTRCPGTPSGRWPGAGCWARAPPGVHARCPVSAGGLLLALPALEGTGLLECARATYGRLRNGFYGLEVMLPSWCSWPCCASRGPRARLGSRSAALGRVLGLDRAPEVKTIRRKLAELAEAGKAADLIMALARHHAAARPDALGFLYVDGHARAYLRHPHVQKTHVARLKFPAPATRGDLGHRRRRRPGAHGHRRAVGLPGRRAAQPAPATAPGRGGRTAGDGLLRPRRLVTGPVRRHHRRRVRPAHLPQRHRSPTCPPRRSPRSPAPTIAAGRTSTSWPTPWSPWTSPKARARARL